MKTTPYLEQIKQKLSAVGTVTTRPMMGGFLVYINGKYVACVDDDVLYVKKFPENAEIFNGCPERPPYDGAKPLYVPDVTDDAFLKEAMILTFIGAAKANK